MLTLIICSGPSGSGKTTLANQLKEDYNYCEILSTDDYWLRPDGTYSWNARELEQAHEWNYKRFVDIMNNINDAYEYLEAVIIDNTNLRFSDFRRYVKLALQNGWEVKIVRPETEWMDNPEELFKRNVHDLPMNAIERQLARMQSIEELQEELVKLKEEVIQSGSL